MRIATLQDSRESARTTKAMPSCEVQRTLVKSPPELWAELSDPASLAKHLGDFGEIRTIRVEPETAVEWEAQDVRGVVQLKPSGWGTKVTLTAIRELAAEEVAPEAKVEAEPQAEPEPEPRAEHEPEPQIEPEPQPEPALAAEPEAEHEMQAPAEPEAQAAPEPEAASRPRLFARIVRWWRRERPDTEAQPESEAPSKGEPELDAEPAAELEPAPEPEPEPTTEPAPEDPLDLAAELAQVEAEMQAQDAALLSAVLDRLGAAHHRPFSRG